MDLVFMAVQSAIRKEGYRIAEESGDPDPRFWSEALAEAAIAAIRQDHVIVPKEPTEAMIAAAQAITGYRGDWTATDYRAMIAAAPKLKSMMATNPNGTDYPI